MTAALPARAAAERGGGLGRGEGGRRKRRRSRDRRDPGAESDSEKDTARRPALFQWSLPFATHSGGGRDPGRGRCLGLPRPPPLGHTPSWGGCGGRWPSVGRGGAPGEAWGGACSQARSRSPPWSGGAAPALANSRLSAGAGTGEEVGAWERGVLGRGAPEGSRDGAPGEGAACSRSGVEFLLSCFLQMQLGMFSGELGYCPACLSLSTSTLLHPTPPAPPAPQPALSPLPPKGLPFLPQGGSLALWPPHRPAPVGA